MNRMERAVVVFTRDLRLHDHPALTEALSSAREIVPLFVFDERAAGRSGPRRRCYMLECVADLREQFRYLGGDLIVRHGHCATETLRLAREVDATAIYLSRDVTSVARRRERDLATMCAEHRIALRLCEGVTAVPPGSLRPAGDGDHYKVFAPYWQRWRASPRRPIEPSPRAIRFVRRLDAGELPAGAEPPNRVMAGGERESRRCVDEWIRSDAYARYRDDGSGLAPDATSHLGAALHFGCVSPLALAREIEASDSPAAEAFLRQLCWRDFLHQVTAAFPAISHADYRPGRREWRDDPDAFDRWREGATGIPLVDAAMRQLRVEGTMPNRARMVVASYLTKTMGIHWKRGADHFAEWLIDHDVANNYGNWQWVAGTGNDTRPNRVLNPVRQAARFDRDGRYVHTWLGSAQLFEGTPSDAN